MRHAVTRELIKAVLGDEHLGLSLTHYQVTEEIGNGRCRVEIAVRQEDGPPEDLRIVGEGVGVIDAAFHGLMAHFAQRFGSLRTITFTQFAITGSMDTGREQNLDAEAVVQLQVKNSEGLPFDFERRGRSTVAATLDVVLDAVGYFINSERAFIRVHTALLDARRRDRADLTQTYTAQLAELVNTTSYTEVIERIRREAL